MIVYFFKNLRRKECLDFIDIDDDDFISELHSGKFTILVCFYNIFLKKLKRLFSSNIEFMLIFFLNLKPFLKNYPVCALFTVRLNNGCSNPSYELTTLKTLIYQLDAALEK